MLRIFILFVAMTIHSVATAAPTDPHSCARPAESVVTHLSLDLDVDFEKKQLRGLAKLTLNNSPAAAEFWLDTKALEITEVLLDGVQRAKFELMAEKPFLGRGLRIAIRPETKWVQIKYSTTSGSDAVQWLEPDQTFGKKNPFLFTQGQAILSRTWIPIQDSPGIRFSWDATIRTPKNLMAVMSGSNPVETAAEGVYRFRMELPVPAYLIALSVGELSFQPLGAKTGVYAEPGQLKAAAYEFGEMEQMLKAAEALYGPYQWGRYDVLVLPPSFPFGGMENPKLTFATPTIIAGDRSLTSLIAHELAHSWSGNLVTNSTWNDFWLNEGFTVYFERRIMEAISGKDYADMLAVLGYQDLIETLNDLGRESAATHLKLDLAGKDPDDGMNDIAYEKGYFFLRWIEDNVGRAKFDDFLKKYFREFAFKGIDTEKFVHYLTRQLKNDVVKAGYSEWIYKPGLPSSCPVPVSARFTGVDRQLENYASERNASRIETKDWSTHEYLHFLRGLPSDISREQLLELDRRFGFTQSTNSEIQAAWFLRVIPLDYPEADAALESFLIKVGRRKFVVPIFRSMLKTARLNDKARAIYGQARKGYHAVTIQTLDEIFGKQ